MFASILGLLRFAPAVLEAGRGIVGALTGEEVPADAPAEDVARRIEALPPDSRAQVMLALIAARTRAQELDTQRFEAINDGDVEKLRASARPEIALRAMRVISIFARCFALIMIVTTADWLLRSVYAIAGKTLPDLPSIWALFAQAKDVTELIWAPLLASFWACLEIIKKYFGCRERDKAQQFEMQHGAPLQSTQATIAAAGGTVASIIKAFKGK